MDHRCVFGIVLWTMLIGPVIYPVALKRQDVAVEAQTDNKTVDLPWRGGE